MNEHHQAQFPSDIEVIYIAPPALDEFRRWAQNLAEAQQREMAAEDDGDADADVEDADKP